MTDQSKIEQPDEPEAARPAKMAADPRRDALRAEVRRIAEATSRPMTEIAKEIGVPYGTFSGWIAGTYAGRNERIDEVVQRWLAGRSCAARKRAQLPTGPDFVVTSTAEQVMAVLEHAQHAPDLALISGGAGIGKTSAINAYQARSNNVWIVTGEPCLSTPRAMLDHIAELLGVNVTGSSHKVSRAIVARLRGTHGLLVVDEAQHLGVAVLDQVRTLHDMAGVGVCLVGNERVASRVEGGSRSPEYAQLFSRVGMRLTRAGARKRDLEALLDAWEVTDAGVRSMLVAIAKKPGALRSAMKTLRVAMMQARAADEPLSDRHVELAYTALAGAPLNAGGRS